jgi:hypothetical protein
LREEAWAALELPGSWSEAEPAFWQAFQTGLPTPKVPLLLHAALGREGGACREDWMRVISHLGLVWDDKHLPPDHLGAACEVLACAIEREERVLVRELCERYLLPWCSAASACLKDEDSVLAALPEQLALDLGALG